MKTEQKESKWAQISKRGQTPLLVFVKLPGSILIWQHPLLDKSQNNKNSREDCFYQTVLRDENISAAQLTQHFLLFFFSPPYLFLLLQLTVNMWAGCSDGTETWVSVWSGRWMSSGPQNSSRASWTPGRNTGKKVIVSPRIREGWFWLSWHRIKHEEEV